MTEASDVEVAGAVGSVLGAVARGVWKFRRGVMAAVVLYVAVAITSGIPSDRLAVGIVVLVVLLAVPPTRRLLCWPVGRWWLRRRWRLGCQQAGLVTPQGRIPTVRRMRAVPCGELLKVRMPPGSHAGDLHARAETMAAFLGVREVRVLREASNARFAWVTVVRRDPLAGGAPLPWPLLGAVLVSLWRPIPLGVDEEGQEVVVSLVERNMLLGGEPGAGKSVALSMPVAAAALDPSVKLTLLDGKLVELAAWRGCAERFAGVDVAEAIEVLRELQREMDARYKFLLSHGRRKVEPGDGMALHVVCVDLCRARDYADNRRRQLQRAWSGGLLAAAALQVVGIVTGSRGRRGADRRGGSGQDERRREWCERGPAP